MLRSSKEQNHSGVYNPEVIEYLVKAKKDALGIKEHDYERKLRENKQFKRIYE